MTEHMTCDQFSDLLSDYLERETDEATRLAMDAHAARCRACGSLLADVREVQVRAANLPELAPSRDLWSGIAARIETPVIELGGKTGEHAKVEKRRWTRRPWVRPSVAAAALVLITAGVTHVMTRRAYAPASEAATRDTSSALTVAAETAQAPQPVDTTVKRSQVARTLLAANKSRSAEQTYDQEIARLRAIVDQRRTQLDTTTLKVIEHNLVVIDSAITQCKDALRRDPASRFLTESLNDALDTKIELLRTAAMLPPRIS